MIRAKQSEEQPFQRFKGVQMGQFSMQEMVVYGSHFGANQQSGDSPAIN